MRLLVAISHHGLGHLAQVAPVLAALNLTRPDLEFLIWSGLGKSALAARIQVPFQHRCEPADVGLVMYDAMRVDLAASRDAYLDFHRDWEARVAREAGWLRAQGITAVLSDVACLPLAAAAQAGIPGVALCSLNWVDIAGAYLAEEAGMGWVLVQVRDAYQSARAFLRLLPAMPMTWLANREDVPAIAARGVDRGALLRASPEDRLLLIGFGGIAYQATLPRLPGVHWLVPDDWKPDRADLLPFSSTGLSFLDLLASCDALITKVGYGSFVEAAAAGIPVLYLDRPDWPETPFLVDWLQEHAVAAAIDATTLLGLASGPSLGQRLVDLWSLPARPSVAIQGAAHAAGRILELLR